MKLEVSQTEHLKIEVCERGIAGIPYDCCIRINLRSEFVQGHSEAWVDGPEMERFLQELKDLDSSLRGEAILSSCNPDELYLEIKPVDSLGHFIFKVKTGRRYFVHSQMSIASSEAAFPLNSQTVSDVCKQLVSYFETEFSA